MNKLANYREEQAALAQLWQPNCRHKIFLLRGKSGCGKTSLLRKCRQEAQENKIACLFMDCKQDDLSAAKVFSSSIDHVGREKLSCFVQYLVQHKVEIRDNQIEGNYNQISVVLNVHSEQERQERLVRLTDAWLEDLKQLNRPLLLSIDTYEKARGELRKWLHSLLTRLYRACPPLRLIVAGQELPSTNTSEEWVDYCCTRELRGVPEPEHWLQMIQESGLQIPSNIDNPLNYFRGICDITKGLPSTISTFIEQFPHRRENV